MAIKKKESDKITIPQIKRATATMCILGTTPLIYNRINAKTQRVLLLPGGKMTAADKAANLKHKPREEYRDSVYRHVGDEADTRLKFPLGAFKRGLADAALDLPGSVTKAKIGRLTVIENQWTDIYGLPSLFMAPVRNSDINHTPDIRTRALLPEWACYLRITYMAPMLNAKAVANLVAASGMIVGIGDYRQQKGAGSYGLFDMVNEDHERFQDIVKNQGRVEQDKALEAAPAYDVDTEELLSWYDEEMERRFEEPTSGVISVPDANGAAAADEESPAN